MKNVQQLCAAIALIVLVSIGAVAGEIHTDVVSPPPPPPAALAVAQSDDVVSVTERVLEPELITWIIFQMLAVF